MGSRLFGTCEVEQDGLHVEIVVQPAINYALVVNRVPIVRRVTVTNRSAFSIHDLRLELTIVGPHGPLAPPWTVQPAAPVPPGRSVSWEEFGPLAPDTAGLVTTEEAYPVDVRLEVTRPDGPAVHLVAPGRVLAHNEWLNHPSLYDSLAAFVQPNTRAVDTVLTAASGILLRHTGSGSIEGYQAGPARAALIAGAVYEALRRAGIAYAGGMAAVEQGQRIRTVASVLEARLANCLDLAVTYAACLEQAGLHPLVFLLDGHAVGGFLLEPERLGSITVTERNLLASLVGAGRAVPVELTRIGPGESSLDFAGAVQAGLALLTGQQAPLLGAIDVALAHRSGIRPMPAGDALGPVDAGPAPAGGTRPEGSIELPPGAARDRMAERLAQTAEVVDDRDPAPPRVRQWKRTLLDLSLRNPLLNLPKRGKGLDLYVPVNALKDLDDLMHAGKRVHVVADSVSPVHEAAGARSARDLDPTILARELREDRRIYAAVTEERYRTVLSGLQRAARTMVQETGGNYLYLTLGTLVHPKGGGAEAHAPLFLLPVRIEGGFGRQRYEIVIDGTEMAATNHCLVEWLRVKHRARLPELEQPIRDEYGIDIPATLQALREGLVAHELDYRIDETASLRLLQFGTFQMWRDLSDHWESFLDNPVVRHLVAREETTFREATAGSAVLAPASGGASGAGASGGGAGGGDEPADGEPPDPFGGDGNPPLDEATLYLPIEADGSQMQAVVSAEQGRSFVLEGPPGTGKSQTITNMIARAIHSGRTVLFVAEKQAALDVVKRRLERVGLGPLALDLHGRKQSINAIRGQLRESMDLMVAADDGAFEAATTRLRSSIAPLAHYPERVHARNAAGLSLWQAYEDTLRYGPGPTASVPTTYLAAPEATREAVEQALAELPPLARANRLRRDHPWSLSELRNVDDLSHPTVLAVAGRIEAAREVLAGRPELAAVVRGLPGPSAVGRLVPAAALARDGLLPSREVVAAAESPSWDNAIAYVQTAVAALWRDFAAELGMFRDEILRWPQLDEVVREAREAADRFLPWTRNKALQRVIDQLAPYVREGVTLNPDILPTTLSRVVAIRLSAVDIEHQVNRFGGLALPPQWRPTRPGARDEFVRAVQATRIARALVREFPEAWAYLTGTPADDDHDVLAAVDQAWRDWSALLRVSDARPGWYDAWQRDGAEWLREIRDEGIGGLHRWAALLRCLDVLRDAGLAEFGQQLLSGEIEADEAELAYRRGVATRAVAERVQAGDLAFFEAAPHTGRIDQYASAAKAVRETIVTHLPASVVRRRGLDGAAAPSPAGSQRAWRELAEQLKRKRGGLSFRELYASYADHILALTPCVLVSPASAAHFIPPDGKKFDIVIFDEASQIRVAEAIGAMGRGRSAVIVGDSKQMPPTTIMQASHGDEDEGEADEEQVPQDLDSILSEAVESRVPQQWLHWHYRSRDESLIAFSNRRYYDSKLYSLPSPTAGTGSTAIMWRRVNGEFDRGRSRTNRIEAQSVVDEIRSRLRDPQTAGESIGVVTFNIQQRDLILDLLEESDDPLVREAMADTLEEPIFVKNLENVQGDERDTILFSLAFSVDPATGALPLNFGPLSQAGGERRLNVAITRAKKLVMLFASFDPSDIDLSRTNAQGTRDLRAYCEVAANGPGILGDLAAARSRRSNEIREQVAAAIRDRGHDVVVGHGLSEFTVDIAVRRPGAAQWQVAIILDGPDWARRSTVADRDFAPINLRRQMRWPELLRFWLPAWLRDREGFLREVDDAVLRATEAEAEGATEDAPDVRAADEAVRAVDQADQAAHEAVRVPAPAEPPEAAPPAGGDRRAGGRTRTASKATPRRRRPE